MISFLPCRTTTLIFRIIRTPNEKKFFLQDNNLSEIVKKIEGKCASVQGDLAGMAMSEQYLRTKQAMLLAKKKEKEMNVSEKIAELREMEVHKMREKVKHMQVR